MATFVVTMPVQRMQTGKTVQKAQTLQPFLQLHLRNWNLCPCDNNEGNLSLLPTELAYVWAYQKSGP